MKNKSDKLRANAKTSLEDYQSQTHRCISKKLVAGVVRHLNYDNLSDLKVKQIAEDLQGIFC